MQFLLCLGHPVYAFLSFSDCDAFGSKNIDAKMKQVIFSRRVSVSCVRRKHEVLVEWEEPKGLLTITELIFLP